MEYLPRGDMRQCLSKSPSLPETEVQQVICQVLEGLSLMHDHKFAHRDLKSGVCLLARLKHLRFLILMAIEHLNLFFPTRALVGKDSRFWLNETS